MAWEPEGDGRAVDASPLRAGGPGDQCEELRAGIGGAGRSCERADLAKGGESLDAGTTIMPHYTIMPPASVVQWKLKC